MDDVRYDEQAEDYTYSNGNCFWTQEGHLQSILLQRIPDRLWSTIEALELIKLSALDHQEHHTMNTIIIATNIATISTTIIITISTTKSTTIIGRL
jgi:hypothetical protein